MAKFDFNNSKYASFWTSRDAANALRIFVNDPDIIAQKDTFWRRNFSVDPILSNRNPDGTAVFSVVERKRNVANMADMRAPLAETSPRDIQGLEAYQGTIPDFAAKGYVETAMEREARERMFAEYFGNDAEILSAYADVVQVMYDEMNQTLSNLAAQSISKGSVSYNYGSGIKGNIYKAPIPVENFVKAGALAWTDPNAKILDYMTEIEQEYRVRSGNADGALKWQIPAKFFRNVILKNEQVIAYIVSWRTLNEKAVAPGMAVNEAMFVEAFAEHDSISPIEIVREGQKDGAAAVSGWKEGVVVLRPVGYAGSLKRAGLLDVTMGKKYGSSVIDTVFTQLDIFTLINSTLNNGRYKEWHTDLLVAAVPTLDEFLDHVIVDTTTADV